jgi:hypothetical protein
VKSIQDRPAICSAGSPSRFSMARFAPKITPSGVVNKAPTPGGKNRPKTGLICWR